MMNSWQGWLYVAAVLIPLTAFAVEFLLIRILKQANAYIATSAIFASFVLSVVGLGFALPHMAHHGAEEVDKIQGEGKIDAKNKVEHAAAHPMPAANEHAADFPWTGTMNWVALGEGMSVPTESLVVKPTPLPALTIPLGIRIDGLSAIMFTMVTFIATLVHLYSIGYMKPEDHPRFFAYLSLFCFSMLALLSSSNVFMVFMCWELVGVCSYLLIGFWYQEKKNSDAANKAFVANRVGDVGMLVGLGLIWSYFGTFDMATINGSAKDGYGLSAKNLRDDMGRITPESVGDTLTVKLHEENAAQPVSHTIPYWALTLAGLGIFAGCVGKSAQFPLHVWLPDAMAGPTPVSALIHAATMVAAGVYLVGRFFPLFTDGVLLYIAYTGGITLLIAATIAMVQTDYKKVLAYSTVSQLGFMMLGLGVGGWSAGLFHLITHACFKALLFLGAGSVYHAVHTYEMPVLGGLLPKMKITGYTMLIATLAIAGVPFFSGFYSKDAILGTALFLVGKRPEHMLLFILPAVGALLTAFYMFRMWFLIFSGTPRKAEAAHGHGHGHADHGHDDHGTAADHAHEGPWTMWVPLVILAVPAMIVGYPWFILPFFGEPVLESLLASGDPIGAVELGTAKWWAMGGSVLIAAAGIAGAAVYYSPRKMLKPEVAAKRLGWAYNLFVHKWYFDEIYNTLLIQPTLLLARNVSTFDRTVVDGVVNGLARITVGLSKFEGFFDKFAVDGLVTLVAQTVSLLGLGGRAIQTGRLRTYLGLLALAVVCLFAGVFYWIHVADLPIFPATSMTTPRDQP